METMFHLLKCSIIEELNICEYTQNQIDFINLNNELWMEPDEFFTSYEPPSVLKDSLRYIEWAKAWILPLGFKIVMEDGSQFIYNLTFDEYYSSWIHVSKPKHAFKKYVQDVVSNCQ